MTALDFAHELDAFGPRSARRAASLAEAQGYCRRLAQSHYENFSVASWLLPRALRQHFYNVYAYCRWADDLADEVGSTDESLALLDWWEEQLAACYRGEAWHPVFVALAETIAEFAIPVEPFATLLVAFRQDQRQPRYDTFDELLGYCRNSANPVGHLVLYLGRAFNAENASLADQICTGLQLANFWQDVARDYDRGRVYLPRETIDRFGCALALAEHRATPEFRQALRFEVDRASEYLTAGLPLVARVPRWLQADVWLFAQGGFAILAQVRRLDYDVWTNRPRVSRAAQLRLLLSWLAHRVWPGSVGPGRNSSGAEPRR
ncbi:MAG: squalene synthase HpnC [Planctomycetes bacterium]|nr:squalene synthase HpnC [Planctomycetota bacterium]